MGRWSKILCAVDFSSTSRAAVEQAAELARQVDADLVLVHVFTAVARAGEGIPPVLTVAEEAELDRSLRRVRSEAEAIAGRPVRAVVAGGSPAAEIARAAAREHADVVVVGTRGRTGVARAVLGSVAEGVVRHAPCAVLVARPQAWGD